MDTEEKLDQEGRRKERIDALRKEARKIFADPKFAKGFTSEDEVLKELRKRAQVKFGVGDTAARDYAGLAYRLEVKPK